MVRKIIEIDKEKCNGCGICVDACHEGAIAMIDGIATLVSDSYCDGLGDCLPECPTGAITMVERKALPFDAETVKLRMAERNGSNGPTGGCPGKMNKSITPSQKADDTGKMNIPSRLGNWPLQIKLVSPSAPYLENADLLIAADCTAFSYGNFHKDFIEGKVCLIGCPKLDEGDYSDKLAEIISLNTIKSITVVRMEVPCCGGIVGAVEKAIRSSGKNILVQTVTISLNGEVL